MRGEVRGDLNAVVASRGAAHEIDKGGGVCVVQGEAQSRFDSGAHRRMASGLPSEPVSRRVKQDAAIGMPEHRGFGKGRVRWVWECPSFGGVRKLTVRH